jgi:hypothetical protein
MLERLGYSSMLVENGQLAIAALAIAANFGSSFDAALTANVLAGDKERLLDAGRSGYLTKPVQLSQLQATLSHWTSPITANVPTLFHTRQTMALFAWQYPFMSQRAALLPCIGDLIPVTSFHPESKVLEHNHDKIFGASP